MNKTQKKIPKLRFPEFSGDWKHKKLEEVAIDIMYGIGAAAKEFDGQNKYLRITDIDEANRLFLPNPLTSPEGNIDDKYYLKDDDIVFARTGASVGKSYLYKKSDGVLVFAGFLIKIHIEAENSNFVFQQTLRDNYKKWVEAMSMRSGQPGLNAEEYKTLKFYYPPLPEQQKIASFLSSIDTKIEQLTKKKSLFEQYKKGVMEQIFPSSSSGQGQRLRFKDENGNDYPDWVEKKLKEFILDFIVPMRDKPKDLTGNIPWCRIEDFNGKYLYKSKTQQGVSEETIKEMNLKVYPINTLLVSCSANLGFCAIVKKELITNQTFIGLFPNLEKVNVDYLYHIMKLSSRRLNVLSSGTTISYLSRQQFENFKIAYPTIKEQTKIANFLTAIDKKIELVNTQIENTQQFKKGLLQQMFV